LELPDDIPIAVWLLRHSRSVGRPCAPQSAPSLAVYAQGALRADREGWVAQARKPSLEATASDVRRWPRSQEGRGIVRRNWRPKIKYQARRPIFTFETAKTRANGLPTVPRLSAPYARVGGRALCVRLPPAAVGHDGDVPQPAQLVRVRVPLRHGRGRAPAGRVPGQAPKPSHRAAVGPRPAGPLPGVLPRDAAR
jgi:hypothetical protein